MSKYIPKYDIRLVRDGSIPVTERPKLNTSDDVFSFVREEFSTMTREVFRALLITSRNNVIGSIDVGRGSLRESVVSPREIIQAALLKNAAAVVCVHNHPSGDPSPSIEDKQVTDKLCKALRYCDINVLDHIIVGDHTYFSFADEGLLS